MLFAFSFRLFFFYHFLNWTTANEKNITNFCIEKSDNGIDWTLSGTIKKNENLLWGGDYSFEDKELNAGLVYYRLKQNDLNGVFMYFDMISVEARKRNSEELTVYPNPSPGTFNFLFNSKDEVSTIDVFNSLGEKVYSGNKGTSINLLNLPEGVYSLQININLKSIIKRISNIK